MNDDTPPIKNYWCTIPEYGDMRGVARLMPDGRYLVLIVPTWFTNAYKATNFYKEIGDDGYVYAYINEAAVVIGEPAPPLRTDVDRQPFYLSFASRASRVIDSPDGWDIESTVWLGDEVIWRGHQVKINPHAHQLK